MYLRNRHRLLRFQRRVCHIIISMLAAGALILQIGCNGIRQADMPGVPSGSDGGAGVWAQTPAQAYAAEVLSYMLQVVVGKAGDPANREAWQTTSLSVALDLDMVGHIMQNPERRMSELMV